ncbi:MAG TPA: hypothetical protein VJ739_16600, partial [Gemmataceae bacterium]|nr:hypothetical protein [Gemmataceae bacterium]
ARRLSQALTRQVTLARCANDKDAAQQQQEHRSIVHWCLRFARAGNWAQIRSYYVWCRLEGTGPDGLRVAIRHELLGQLGLRDLQEMGPGRLADLCERYGVGRRCRAGRGGQRAIELDTAWLQGLLEAPGQAEERDPGQEG